MKITLQIDDIIVGQLKNVGAILDELATFQWARANVARQFLVARIANATVQTEWEYYILNK